MPREENRQPSILIVSGSEQFDACIRKALSGKRYSSVEFRKNAAAARRSMLDREYDLVVINCPLPDEFGHEFAYDVTERGNSSVLLAVPEEIFADVQEHVTDSGILTITKPADPNRLEKAIRFLAAIQNRFYKLEKKIQTVSEKMEEMRIVNKAKLVLMEKRHMTEEEAHRLIGREAMNHGVSRRRIAEQILE